jgi:hypothetical protein
MRTRLSAALPLVVAFLLALLALPALSHADEWKPITPEDLALKDNPADPGAPAMILYRELEHQADLGTRTEYVRIKIFDERGLAYANIQPASIDPFENVPGFPANIRIFEIKGRTIHPDGTVIPYTGHIEEKDISETVHFVAQASWYPWYPWEYLTAQKRVKMFSLPDVTPGSIIEYKIVRKWNAGAVYTSRLGWPVQLSLFQREAHFSFVTRGSLGETIRKDRAEDSMIGYIPFGLRPGQKIVWQGSKFTLDVKDVPAFVFENFMPPRESVRSRVVFFDRDLIFYKSAEDYWPTEGKSWAGEVQGYLDKNARRPAEVAAVIASANNSDDKLRDLYDRVQEFRNSPGKSDESLKHNPDDLRYRILSSFSGDPQDTAGHNELNRKFVALARAAGFDATIVIASPRKYHVFHKSLTNFDQLEDELVLVRVNGKEIYLDPGTPFCPFGILPWEDTGVQGLRADKGAAPFVMTPVPAASDAMIIRKASLSLDADGTLTGTLKLTLGGQEALQIRLHEAKQDEEHRRKYLERTVRLWLGVKKGVKLEQINDWGSSTTSLVASFSVNIPSYATKNAERIEVPATLFSHAYENPFVPADRQYPIYFRYPYFYVDDVTITPPPGFQVETLPSMATQKNNLAEFSTSYAIENGAAHLTRRIQLDHVFVEAKGYPQVKEFFELVAGKNKDQLVLKPAATANTHDGDTGARRNAEQME